jgi:hypothetical protein
LGGLHLVSPLLKADNPIKHFAAAFVIALICYFVAYGWIEHRRTRKGPWELLFTNNAVGNPLIVITQPKLGLSHVELQFPNATVSATNFGRFTLAQPRQVPYPLGFADCIFMDTTFLPGTLTFRAFGHEIELLPRTMIIDHEEKAWRDGESINLPAQADTPGTNAVQNSVK